MTSSPPGRPERSPVANVLGTLLFVPLVPGSAIVLIPWALSRWEVREPLLGAAWTRWIGAALLLAGTPVIGESIVRFVRRGRGTPAFVAPPQRLVITGFYRFVRNPMYLGGLAMIWGQGLVLGSWEVLAYGGAAAMAFHLFVMLYEEPHLRKVFGEEYAAYYREVRRWLPHLRPRR